MGKIREYYSSLIYLVLFIMSHTHLFTFMNGCDNINFMGRNNTEGSKNLPRAFMMDKDKNNLNSDKGLPEVSDSKRRKLDISSKGKSVSEPTYLNDDNSSVVTHDSRNSHFYMGL